MEDTFETIKRIVKSARIQAANGDPKPLELLERVANMPPVDGVSTYQAELRVALVLVGEKEVTCERETK